MNEILVLQIHTVIIISSVIRIVISCWGRGRDYAQYKSNKRGGSTQQNNDVQFESGFMALIGLGTLVLLYFDFGDCANIIAFI